MPAAILLVAVIVALVVWFTRKTPKDTNQTYAQALAAVVTQLQQEGLRPVKQLSPVGGGDPFLLISVPNTGEVTDEQIQQVTQLGTFAA